MYSFIIKNVFAWSFILISFINLNTWNGLLPFSTTFLTFFIVLLYIFLSFRYYKNNFDWSIKLWAIMSIIEIVRGAFIVENDYFSIKSYVSSSLILLLPISVALFKNPYVFKSLASKWFKIGLPAFVLLAPLTLHMTYYHYLCLLYIPIFFLKKIPFVHKVIVIFLVFFCMYDINTRSNTIRIIAFAVIGWTCCSNLITKNIAKLGSIVFLITPIILFTLAFRGIFNIFEMESYLDKSKVNKDLMADTRTFLYNEILSELNNNNAIVYGLSTAGGYNSVFSESIAEQIGSVKDVKRTNAECGILGLALWSGIIGVICYCLLVFHSVFLAINNSRNKYLRGLALLLAFNWAYTWVENTFTLHINNLILYSIIGFCASPLFLRMSDSDIERYFKSIFSQTGRFLKFN